MDAGRQDEFPVGDGMTWKGSETLASVVLAALSIDTTNDVPVTYGRKETETPAFCIAAFGIGMNKGKAESNGTTVRASGRSSMRGVPSNEILSWPHC
jgi:hypothetical protein